MKRRLVFLCAIFSIFAALVSAQPATDWSDFIGSWNVGYNDAVLGRVEGHAVVHATPSPHPLPIEVDITLRHPETDARTRLSAARVERQGTVIKLVLRGASPSGPSTTVPRQPGGSRQIGTAGGAPLDVQANELQVPPRTMLTARLRGSEVSAHATVDDASVDPIDHEITLEGSLVPGAALIGWQWSYAHPGLPPGLRGRRVGAVKDAGKTVFGEETWTQLTKNGIAAVEQEGGFTTAPDGDHGAEVFATLKVRGFSLPVAAGNAIAVEFLDSLVRFERVVSTRPGSGRTTGPVAERQDELRIQVRIGAGIAPGSKNFSVNGMEAVWPLRLPAALPAMRLLALQSDGSFAPSNAPCIGDTVRLEADFNDELPFDQRLARLRVGRETFGPLLFSRAAESKGVHMSPTFRLAPTGEDPAAAREIPAVTAAGGDTLVVEGVDSVEPVEWSTFKLLSATARDQVTLVVRPGGIWTSDTSLTDLSKEDRFSVMVRVPAAQAASVGDNVEVELLVRGTKRSAKLVLVRGSAHAGAPVVFAMRQPATFGGGVSKMMFGDTLEFNRTLLRVADGETVDFKFQDATAAVRIHDTALKKRLDVRRRQVATLLAGVMSAATNPQLTDVERNRVLARGTMLSNALVIGRSRELFGAEQVAVLEAYLNLVNEPNLTPINGTLRPYGATYVFSEEANAVYRAIKIDAREVIRDAAIGMSRDVTVGMVEFVAERTGAGGIYTAVTGRTVMGQRVNFLQRVLAAAGAISAMKDSTVGTAWAKDRFTSKWAADAEAKRQAWRDAEKKRQAAAAAGAPVSGAASSGATPSPRPPITVPNTTNPVAPDKTAILPVADMPPPASASERMAERLRKAGVRSEVANDAAEDIARRHPELPSSVAEAGIAADADISAAQYMQRTGITADEYAERLDQYYRTVVGIDDPKVRARMARRAMGELTPPKVRSAAEAAEKASGIATVPPSPQPNAGGRPPTGVTVDSPRPPLEPSVAAYLERQRMEMLHDRALDKMDDSEYFARKPHTDPTIMRDVIEDRVKASRVELEILGRSPEQMAAAERQIREEFARLQPGVDKIEAVLGTRTLDDYHFMEVVQSHGCTETEALVGRCWNNGGRVDRQRMMQVLGLDAAQTKRALDEYLRKSQHVDDPALRARAVKEFFSDQPATPPTARPVGPPPAPTTATPSPAPRVTGATPPKPSPLPDTPRPVTQPTPTADPREREVVGGLMRREWDRILTRRNVTKTASPQEYEAANAEYKRRFPSTEQDQDRYGQTAGTIARSADGKTLTITTRYIPPDESVVPPPKVHTIPVAEAPVDFQLKPGESTGFSYTNVSPSGG